MTITEPPLQKKVKSEAKSAASVSSANVSFQAFSGPIPPPEILKQYDFLFPGIAQRYLEEPLKESSHRRALEEHHLRAKVMLSKRGQIMAYSLALLCVLGAFSLLALGFSLAGLSTFFGALAVFVGVFVKWGKKAN